MLIMDNNSIQFFAASTARRPITDAAQGKIK
jgi:hypothetical protein